MKAMILAAGKGTRLEPLTNDVPKAMVLFQGLPLLEIVLRRLRDANITDVVINVHHFADQIVQYVKQRAADGLNIVFSFEEELLDTGGGIKNAASLLGDEPVLFHNVDILSDLDLKEFMDQHEKSASLFTLAVTDRQTSRSLLFNSKGCLSGWAFPDRNLKIITRESRQAYLVKAFSGIYIIHPSLFSRFPVDPVFSLTPWMLEVSKSVDIHFTDHSTGLWFDLGRLSGFKKAEMIAKISENGLPMLSDKPS